MITLIHLLEHLGLPSGAAIAGKKFLKGGIARTRRGGPRSRPEAFR
jgi:hypothetical protein